MKDQVLSIERMQHLKELGIDTSKASMVLIVTDEYGDVLDWDEEIYKYEAEDKNFEYLDAATGNYDHSYRMDCGVFTLQDILDLLPEKITVDYESYSLNVIFPNDGLWEISYSFGGICYEYFMDTKLIDAAYEMLLWCAENGYIKTNKED